MSAGIFLIALLGCGEAEAPCQQIKVLKTRYETKAACAAATEAVLMSNLDADFPVIVAQCQTGNPASRVQPVRRPAPRYPAV